MDRLKEDQLRRRANKAWEASVERKGHHWLVAMNRARDEAIENELPDPIARNQTQYIENWLKNWRSVKRLPPNPDRTRLVVIPKVRQDLR